jgi:large subunit ribosomal protein L29
MKASELRTKTKDELIAVLQNSKKELMNLRFKKATGAFSQVNKISELKKLVARVYTLLNDQKSER